MYSKSKVFWITSTAIYISLLVTMQAVTAPLGNTLLTGSIVNLLLIVSIMTIGYGSGLAVAIVSPIMAKFAGVGTFWSLIPFIILGNITLVLLWRFIGTLNMRKRAAAHITALVCGAIGKFIVLYAGIVKIAVPMLLNLPEPQASVVSNMFSVPQLITALTGGVLALILYPVIEKAILKMTS